MNPLINCQTCLRMLVWTAACCLVLPGVTWSQEEPQWPEQVAPEDKRVTFDFPGGSLREYVVQVTELSDGFNVVVDPSVADEKVAAVQAKRMPAEDAVAILEELVEIDVEHVGQSGTLIVTSRQIERPRERMTDVLSVRDLLASGTAKQGITYSLDDVLSALEAALNMNEVAKGSQSANIKLHKETGLLLIEGSPHDVNVVNRVIDQLRQGQQISDENKQRALPVELFEKEKQIAELMTVIRERELQVKQMEVQLGLLEVKLEKARSDKRER